jgi:hypothetical protein
MGEFKGQMQVPGVVEWPLSVRIELEGERICIAAAGYEVGNWSLDEVEIKSRDTGFEVHARGESFFVATDDDPEFALEVGMRRAIPNIDRAPTGATILESPVGAPSGSVESDSGAIPNPREEGRPSLRLNILKGRHQRRAGRHLRSLFRRA